MPGYDELAQALASQRNALDNESERPPALLGSWLQRMGSAYPRQPYAWTADYPNLAAFLRKAPEALLALPGRSVAGGAIQPNRLAQPAMPSEWPTQAAVRIGDKTFTGSSHFDAVTKAQAALGDAAFDKAMGSASMDGFVTSAGRYVGREEAGRMLDQRNQTNHFSTTMFGRERKGKDSLLSEALDLYDVRTGQEK